MFSNLGWEEILLLAIVGLVVIGPERLPKAIQDLGRVLRELRTMARGAASDLQAELGPEMADLNLQSLNPRRIVQDALFGDDEPSVPATPAGVGASAGRPKPVALEVNEQPPYDSDAT